MLNGEWVKILLLTASIIGGTVLMQKQLIDHIEDQRQSVVPLLRLICIHTADTTASRDACLAPMSH